MHALDPFAMLLAAVSVYVTLLAGFAAVAATRAVEEDDRPSMGARVSRAVNRATLWLGAPALAGLVWLLAAQAGPGQGSGVMTRDVGLCVVLVVGALGLLVVWVATTAMSLVSVAVARQLPATAVGLVVFAFTSCGAPVVLLSVAAGGVRMT